MGDLCAFYDRPVASSRHTDHAPHSQPPTSHITLQSARNPRWYLGFGPNTPRARRNLGLNYFKGTTIQFSRKMKRRTNPHLRKCDYRFVSGIFTPHDTPTFSTPPHPQKEADPAGPSAPSEGRQRQACQVDRQAGRSFSRSVRFRGLGHVEQTTQSNMNIIIIIITIATFATACEEWKKRKEAQPTSGRSCGGPARLVG